MEEIAVVILSCISGASNAVMDKVSFHFYESIFSEFENEHFWNPSISWSNKYKGRSPLNGERFFLSTSLLVWTTDAWHLFKTISKYSLIASVALAGWTRSLPLIGLSIISFGLTFTLCFNKLFKR